MIETLISSKTRIKLLLKFFLNGSTTAYLRHLETEFGESSNGIRVELNKFEEAGMLTSEMRGNKKFFQANQQHPLYDEIHSIVRKYVGLDKIVEHVIHYLGNLERVYLTGDFARGLNSDLIDLILIGKDIDRNYLLILIDKAEGMIKRKIRYVIYAPEEFSEAEAATRHEELLLLWQREQNEALNGHNTR